MKGLVFAGDRQVSILDFPDPSPKDGEVVIKIRSSGMCGSDLHFFRAEKGMSHNKAGFSLPSEPIIGGHEPCGEVVLLGSNVDTKRIHIGDRMMIFHYVGCRMCGHCHAGWDQLCEEHAPIIFGVNAHGGHGEYMTVPAHTLLPLPAELSYAAGAAICCGTGTAYGALRRLKVSGTDTIAIFGQGPVGLSATQLAHAMGARVIAVDVVPDRLDKASVLGASEVINPKEADALEQLKVLTHGIGVDLALDTSGAEQARIAAIQATKVWGRVAFVGEGGTVPIEVSPMLIRKQLTVLGSWTFSASGQMECARFVADREIDLDLLFSHRWSLDQGQTAYEIFDKQSDGKGVFLL